MDIRIESARKLIKDKVDRILETVSCRDFVEFVCMTGGDCHVCRVYNDGSVVER